MSAEGTFLSEGKTYTVIVYVDGRNTVMEVFRRRVRNLEPARPLRRMNVNQDELHISAEIQRYSEAEPLKITEKPENIISVEQFYEIFNLHRENRISVKTERISYSRDFLIKLADSPMAKKKPDFLPAHPVILEKARDQDVHQLLGVKWT